MNQPHPPPSAAPAREEPEIDPAEAFQLASDTVKARLSMARSIAIEVFGSAVENETIVAVYDRLGDQIAELFGGGGEEEE